MSDLEDRIRRLEDLAYEGDGLTRAVTRLGVNAATLGDVLIQVDRQQQALTRLGGELNKVREEDIPQAKADATQVAQAEADKLSKQRQDAFRLWGSVIALALVTLGLALAFTINSDYHACVTRQERLEIKMAMFRDIATLAQSSEVADRIHQGNRELNNTRTDCVDAYPIHWPRS